MDFPFINISHALALGLADRPTLETMCDRAQQVNAILCEYMREIHVEVVDIKLEFGRADGELLLADEITPDIARFQDARTGEPLDLERFRRDLGNPVAGYQDLLRRMMGES